VADRRVLEQVFGILGMEGVAFSPNADKTSMLVPYGSSGVYISIRDWGESTIVYLRATVLGEIERSDERTQTIFGILNEANKKSSFGKLYYDTEESQIILEYDLLGDHLDGSELMNALRVLTTMADELDERLSTEIGSGMKSKDLWDRETAASQGPDAGPVVNA